MHLQLSEMATQELCFRCDGFIGESGFVPQVYVYAGGWWEQGCLPGEILFPVRSRGSKGVAAVVV